MGNYNPRPIVFRQSPSDFPCPVALGKKTPSFSLHRFRQGLRFIPPDDDGFVLRGDRRRLLYKGRRRSHRITILGDTAFEYDCILLREPESNVISLLIDGAENYDFFRQPDFVKNPFLKGSYAVYKKVTLLGEGTGKLCHIHRPLIIDALGRRVWGELAVVGNVLRITIPEWWLARAKYPVVVDPTVGTSTVGNFAYSDEYHDMGSSLLYEIAVNKFLATERIEGQCTAWAYFSHLGNHSYYYYQPRIYDDNNNRPLTRRSCNEGEVFWGHLLDDNYNMLSTPNTPKWKSATFNVIGTINQGSYIWFGGYGYPYYPRFDYGAIMYKTYQEYIYENDDEDEGIEYPDFPYFGYERTYDRKVSWYFEYTTQSQNYVRTLTHGVSLNDSLKQKIAYQRNIMHNAGVHSLLNGFAALYRSIQETIQGIDNQKSSVVFVRALSETLNVNGIVTHIGEFYRGLLEDIQVDGEVKSGRFFSAKIIDTVHTVGVVFRSLTLLVRIITKVFVRDYLLSRFLKAREELILKSCITRALTIDSRIN